VSTTMRDDNADFAGYLGAKPKAGALARWI
jgi:hypothetical protein